MSAKVAVISVLILASLAGCTQSGEGEVQLTVEGVPSMEKLQITPSVENATILGVLLQAAASSGIEVIVGNKSVQSIAGIAPLGWYAKLNGVPSELSTIVKDGNEVFFGQLVTPIETEVGFTNDVDGPFPPGAVAFNLTSTANVTAHLTAADEDAIFFTTTLNFTAYEPILIQFTPISYVTGILVITDQTEFFGLLIMEVEQLHAASGIVAGLPIMGPNHDSKLLISTTQFSSLDSYEPCGATHPAYLNVHDVLVQWEASGGPDFEYSCSSSLGFLVTSIDGNSGGLGWCFSVDGTAAEEGISIISGLFETIRFNPCAF